MRELFALKWRDILWLLQKRADLFKAEFEVLLCDRASTYFEGAMEENCPYREFCAVYSRCHSPRRATKLKEFVELLECGEP
jgi:hypothetical protein